MSNVIIYTTEDGAAKIELRLENGTVWLSQAEIAELFQTTKQNISKHIQAIFDDQELDETATVNQQLIVQNEGDREVSRAISFYNLDVILAVGYRVRSVRGVQFRRYASTVLKEYLEKGFALNDERLKNLGGGNYWKELLDRILSSAGRKLLENAGTISHTQAEAKAKLEYQKYKAKTLEQVEKEYLKAIGALEHQAKSESQKKRSKK